MLEGNRSKRRVGDEPVAEPGPCSPPAHLSADARAIWEELAGELEAKGLLAPRYVIEFGAFCECVVQLHRAAAMVAATGPLVRGQRGEGPVTNPASREFARYVNLTRNLGADFGLSPAAVTALGRNLEEPYDPKSPARWMT